MRIFFFGLALLFSLFGCHGTQSPSSGGGGIEVGNGMRTFYSTAYGFTLQFSPELDLTVSNSDLVRIENHSLIEKLKMDSLHQSSLEFRGVLARVPGDGSLPRLLAMAEKQFGPQGYSVRAAENSPSPGVVAERMVGDGRQGIYYFIDPAGRVLHFEMTVSPEGKGLALIAPIMATFSYDGIPPKIHRVKLLNSEIRAGDPLSLEVDAEDENSGLLGGKLRISLVAENRVEDESKMIVKKVVDPADATRTVEVGATSFVGSTRINVTIPITPQHRTGEKTYLFQIPTSAHQTGDVYLVKELTIEDLAGNGTRLVAAILGPKGQWEALRKNHEVARATCCLGDDYGNLSEANESLSQLLKVKIAPERPDEEGPDFLDLEFPSVVRIPKYPAQTSFPAILHATDKVSGMVGGKIEIKFCTIDFRYIPGFSVTENITAEQRRGDSYEITISPPPDAPAERYFACHITLYDLAGNFLITSDIDSIFEVRNDNPPGAGGTPEVFAVSVSPATVKKGQWASLRIRTKEQASLIGGKISVVLIPKEPSPKSSEIRFSAPITRENLFPGSEYRFLFRITPFLRLGKFILSDLTVTDRSGRSQIFWEDTYTHPWGPPKGGVLFVPKKIPLPDFEIVP